MKRILIVGLLLLMIALMFFWGESLNIRIDLTSDKRYTLSEQTKELLSKLKNDLYVDIFLSGELPYELQKLQEATVDLLEQMDKETPYNITFKELNVNGIHDSVRKQQVLEYMYKAGLYPSNYTVKRQQGYEQLSIYPYATINYGKSFIPVKLLSYFPDYSRETNITNSMQLLEYQVSLSIKQLLTKKKSKIAFIANKGTLNHYQTADITRSLFRGYEVHRVPLHDTVSLNQYKLLILAKPTQPFTPREKYMLDQYVMRGGRLLALIDPIHVSLDSLRGGTETLAFPLDLNLRDQFFQYGVRVNPVLMLDKSSSVIEVNVANRGEQSRFERANWYYSPILIPPPTNIITKDVNPIKGEFMSSLDTIKTQGLVKKTILLQSSPYTILQKTPQLISLAMVSELPSIDMFKKRVVPVAVLLEGNFPSAFRFRNRPEHTNQPFVEESKEARMIVVTDGDIIRNDYSINRSGELSIGQLGYDKFAQRSFGNKDFLLNCINYLCDDDNLSTLRGRTLISRPLNMGLIEKDLLFWQVVNVGVPIIILMLLGATLLTIRYWKYRKRA